MVIRLSIPKLRERWADETLSMAALAAEFNCSKRALYDLGRRLKLKPRPPPRFPPAQIDPALMRVMWRDGVRMDDIARHFECSRTAVHRQCKLLGLKRRPRSTVWRSLGEFYALQIKRANAARLRAEREAAAPGARP